MQWSNHINREKQQLKLWHKIVVGPDREGNWAPSNKISKLSTASPGVFGDANCQDIKKLICVGYGRVWPGNYLI
jgi:hypothetical protein